MAEQRSKLFNFSIFVFTALFLLAFSAPSFAQEGRTQYTSSKMQFHDGTGWKDTHALDMGENCTVGLTGANRYYTTSRTMQFCNGTDWLDMAIRLSTYTCSNGSWSGAGAGCSTPGTCTGSGATHGSAICCESAPTRSCLGQYRQYTCQTNGNWSGPSGYYTSGSGNCSSTGSYENPDTVRCASTPNANGCDLPSTATEYTCSLAPPWSPSSGIWNSGGSCSPIEPAIQCNGVNETSDPGETRCCSNIPQANCNECYCGSGLIYNNTGPGYCCPTNDPTCTYGGQGLCVS